MKSVTKLPFRTSLQNSSKTVKFETENIEFDRNISEERYISPEQREEIIDDHR